MNTFHQKSSTIASGSRKLSRPFLILSLALFCHATTVGAQNVTQNGTITTSAVIGNVTLPPGNVTNATSVPSVSPTTPMPVLVSLPIETMPPTTFGPVVTGSPTSGATGSDTPAPTSTQATQSPTISIPPPTIATLAPVTMPPTVATMAPTEATTAPTTGNPTSTPTASPTITTMSPTIGPPTPLPAEATAPTNAPSMAPSVLPSTSPSMMPSMSPSTAASMATGSPTSATATAPPTMGATGAPTVGDATGSPTVETPGNTTAPTTDTTAPTTAPTVPEGTEVTETVANLVMTFVGLNQELGPDAKDKWKLVSEEHVKDYFQQNGNLGIDIVETTFTLVSEKFVSVRRRGLLRRQLQTTSIEATYSQDIRYRTPNADRDTPETVAKAPFQTPADLETYLESLKAASTEFEDVTSVLPVEEGPEAPTSAPEKDDGDDGLGTGAIIGIVCGSVAGVAAILGIGYYVSQRGDDGGYVSTGKTPPTQLDVGLGDEVSTLAEPNTNMRASGITNNVSGESIQGYGDQSVATVDYDYSKAYGGGGDNSVSSAGGTFGSQTHTQAAGGAVTLGTSGTGNGPLDTSFSEGGPNARGQSPNVREELIDIYAPPGKLGVVIDTPDDGAPVVHAVKDSSVIADKLQVGDKLVAVDDEDVRSMTAIKVSKLISRKSANASRKLSIIRTVVVDE